MPYSSASAGDASALSSPPPAVPVSAAAAADGLAREGSDCGLTQPTWFKRPSAQEEAPAAPAPVPVVMPTPATAPTKGGRGAGTPAAAGAQATVSVKQAAPAGSAPKSLPDAAASGKAHARELSLGYGQQEAPATPRGFYDDDGASEPPSPLFNGLHTWADDPQQQQAPESPRPAQAITYSRGGGRSSTPFRSSLIVPKDVAPSEIARLFASMQTGSL